MIRPLQFPVPALLLTAALTAQVPTDHVVVLESAGFGFPSCACIDTFGGGATPLSLGFNPIWIVQPPTGIAIDRANASDLWLLNSEGASPGLERLTIDLLARPSSSTGITQQNGGTRVRVGTSRVFTLRAGGVVEGTPKNGGNPFVVLTRPDAVDLAVAGSKLWVACRDAANPQNAAPVIEFDLQTAQQRTVGLYPDVTRIAASSAAPVLALGSSSGLVAEISVATGAITNVLPAGGPVVGLGYSRLGTPVWASELPLGGFAVFGTASALPVHTSAGTFVDLDVAIVPAASVVPFGNGCGAGALAFWDAATPPQLGNGAFAIDLRALPPSQPVALFFGTSRQFSPLFGLPLPIDLSVIANACSLLVDPVVPFPLFASANGDVTQALPIPNTPSLAGVEWSGQAFVPDPSVGPLQLAATLGIVCRLDV